MLGHLAHAEAGSVWAVVKAKKQERALLFFTLKHKVFSMHRVSLKSMSGQHKVSSRV